MQIELEKAEVVELVTVLGAASGVFMQLAEEHVGVPAMAFRAYQRQCDIYIKKLTEQHNRPVTTR